MWAEGPDIHDGRQHGHYLNMTKPDYGALACGFAVAPDGSLWVTQNFIPAAMHANPYWTGFGPTPKRLAEAGADDMKLPAAKFEAACVTRINEYRSAAKLPALASWPPGPACAISIAQAYIRDGTPGEADTACLQGHSWALSECREFGADPLQSLDRCLKRDWDASGVRNADPRRKAAGYMSSTEYASAACGFATASNGEVTIVRLYIK
jgi:hypothetical protein